MTKEGATLTPAAQLCMKLMRAESVDEVRDALTIAGYWDDQSAWRLFGDNDNNYAPSAISKRSRSRRSSRRSSTRSMRGW